MNLKKKTANAKRMAIAPWVEKYRPQTIDDVVYQDEVVSALKKSLETGNLPHLLFYGPPGTGKTSTIIAVAKQLYGTDLYKDRVLELNASDERGIDVVRKKVKNFSKIAISSVTMENGVKVPPFKIIILDEADSMTADAQNALRRTIELSSTTTRFCLICNYVTRIIEPLTSRCAKFRFRPLKSELIVSRLKFISEQEKLNVNEDIYTKLTEFSGGDMRKAITYLQSAIRLFGSEEYVIADMLNLTNELVPDSVISKLIQTCKSKAFEKVESEVEALIAEGFAANQILLQLHTEIVNDAAMEELAKANILMAIGEADKCLIDGADELLQLLSVASTMCKAL